MHAGRLHELVHSSLFSKVIRSKGIVWIGSRSSICGTWDQVGAQFAIEPRGPWICSVPSRMWPPDILDSIANDGRSWHVLWGDRYTEVAIIGQFGTKHGNAPPSDQVRLRAGLQACEMTDAEMWGSFESGPPQGFKSHGLPSALDGVPSDQVLSLAIQAMQTWSSSIPDPFSPWPDLKLPRPSSAMMAGHIRVVLDHVSKVKAGSSLPSKEARIIRLIGPESAEISSGGHVPASDLTVIPPKE